MKAEIEAVFDAIPPERTRDDKDEFRYEMFNRSAACQRAIGDPRILEVIEPLLGDDCHVIANTAWKNPPDFKGGPWHCDAGPHVPRPEGRRVGRPDSVSGVRGRRAHHARRLRPRRRPDRGRAGEPSLGTARALRPDEGREPHLRRSPAPRSSRCGPATSSSSSPTRGTGAAGTRGRPRTVLPAVALRAATSRNGCANPARRSSARRRRSRGPTRRAPDPHRPARPVLLRRLKRRATACDNVPSTR